MAEFSKQYIQLNDPEDSCWDFDIDEETKKIAKGSYINIICEGFGFIAIGRTDEDEISFCYRDWNTGDFIWRYYDEVINEEMNKL